MAIADTPPLSGGFPRCTQCGGVIGVYEPVLRVLDGDATTTSRASEPSLSAHSPGRLYHAVCYELGRRPRAE